MPAPKRRPRQLEFPPSALGPKPDHRERLARNELAELELIAPVRVRRIGGKLRAFPDLANFLPSRVITRDEARLRGWPVFYPATPCLYGHIAPRYVDNSLCVDCRRTKAGKGLIGIYVAPAETTGADMQGGLTPNLVD